jgi:succinate dehydrogenase/fumarate reductase flavoprotein subunit
MTKELEAELKWTEDRLFADTCKVSDLQKVDGNIKARITKIAETTIHFLEKMGVPKHEIY